MPSRIGSGSSKVSKRTGRVPTVPRRSSRRASSQDAAADAAVFGDPRLSTVPASPPSSPNRARRQDRQLTSSNSGRFPFASDTAYVSPAKSNRYSTGAESTTSSAMHVGGDEENETPAGYTHHPRHSSSVLGAHAPDLREDRPSSVGFVQQHRASDHIHVSPESPEFTGSSAEFLGQPIRR